MTLSGLARTAAMALAASTERSRYLDVVGDKLLSWAQGFEALLFVCVALGAGLAAAYGRELQSGRSPNRLSWIARLLLLPMLAIGASAASEAFAMSRNATAFTAAMLSLGGYDCLRLMEAQWKGRLKESRACGSYLSQARQAAMSKVPPF